MKSSEEVLVSKIWWCLLVGYKFLYQFQHELHSRVCIDSCCVTELSNYICVQIYMNWWKFIFSLVTIFDFFSVDGLSVWFRSWCWSLFKLITAADVILWRRKNVTVGILLVTLAAWVVFERSGYTLLSLVSSVLLLLIAILFLWAKAAAILNR